MAVDVPELSLALPQIQKTGLQELEEKKDIKVGIYRDKKTFALLPLSAADLKDKAEVAEAPTRLVIDVRLGRVTIVRGTQAEIVVTGEPKIIVAGETRLDGQIRAVEGKLSVQGKEFKVEKATVTFDPAAPPSNPVVVATAEWDAQDGSKVYADFIGPVKTGKLNLRSEPARPQNEILALILFGTADGATGSPTAAPGKKPGAETQAGVAVAGGVVSEGLTEALDDLAGVRATARVDTTRANNPAPELEFQVTRDVSVQFTHVLGTPPITEPDLNLATVDWRFARKWSLETTVGDKGKAQVDAVWQHRY